MADGKEPAADRCLSRSELEMELARITLVLMRSAPHAFGALGCDESSPHRLTVEWFRDSADRLLARARPAHRAFLASRLQEIANSSAGLCFQGFDQWIAPDRRTAESTRADRYRSSREHPRSREQSRNT
ncbi:MAG: hypothetical protein EPO46_09885 [Lysobacter sp.]|nr:MAG: hypothetical protein EPO46_09885 [Lysobacter sp.]